MMGKIKKLDEFEGGTGRRSHGGYRVYAVKKDCSLFKMHGGDLYEVDSMVGDREFAEYARNSGEG